MAALTRRKLLGAGVLAALVSGMPDLATAFAADLDEGRCRTAREAELLRFYQSASATEKAAILRLMERTLAGDDMHAVGVECLMAFGIDEAEAHARTRIALEGAGYGRTGDSA